jgi:hypothetical protein
MPSAWLKGISILINTYLGSCDKIIDGLALALRYIHGIVQGFGRRC